VVLFGASVGRNAGSRTTAAAAVAADSCPTAERLAEEPFADDVVALRTVTFFHRAPLL